MTDTEDDGDEPTGEQPRYRAAQMDRPAEHDDAFTLVDYVAAATGNRRERLERLAENDPDAVVALVRSAVNPDVVVDALYGLCAVREATSVDAGGVPATVAAIEDHDDTDVTLAGVRYLCRVGLAQPEALREHLDFLVHDVLLPVEPGDSAPVRTIHDATKAVRGVAAQYPGDVAPYVDDVADILTRDLLGHKERKVCLRTLRAVLLREHAVDARMGKAADSDVSVASTPPSAYAGAVVPRAGAVAAVLADTPRTSTAERAATVLHGIAVVDASALVDHLDVVVEAWTGTSESGNLWRDLLGLLEVVARERPDALAARVDGVTHGIGTHVRRFDRFGPDLFPAKFRSAVDREVELLARLGDRRPVETGVAAERLVGAAEVAPGAVAGGVPRLVSEAAATESPRLRRVFLDIAETVVEAYPGALTLDPAPLHALRTDEGTTSETVARILDRVETT